MTKHLLASALTLALVLPAIATPPPATNDRPTVILILADDLGDGMLSHNGQKIVTPPISTNSPPKESS